jgi:hypothetical protein
MSRACCILVDSCSIISMDHIQVNNKIKKVTVVNFVILRGFTRKVGRSETLSLMLGGKQFPL